MTKLVLDSPRERGDRGVVTTFMYPPIPVRSFDWLAMYDDDDGDSPRKGWGATEEEAIADLLTNHGE